MTDRVRRELRAAAGAYRPDRQRMLARVRQGTGTAGSVGSARPARAPRPRRPGPRIAAATAAVTGVVLLGGYVMAGVGPGEGRPAGGPATAVPPTTGAPSVPQRAHGPATDGPLRTDGGIDPHGNPYWAQSNVTVRTAAPLAALTVELRVARTAGVRSTGSWHTLPERDVRTSVRVVGGRLVYRWTLLPGRTVPAGKHVFAGQYDHARGDRDAGRDRYVAAARAADGEALRAAGDFAPRDVQR